MLWWLQVSSEFLGLGAPLLTAQSWESLWLSPHAHPNRADGKTLVPPLSLITSSRDDWLGVWAAALLSPAAGKVLGRQSGDLG